MSDDGGDAGLFPVRFELRDLFGAVRLAGPLARRLGKDLNRVAIHFFAEQQSVADASRDRHMRPQERSLRWFILALHIAGG